MVPDKSQFCLQVPNFISKDVEKSQFRSRSRDFCQFFEGFGFEKFGLGKKVSVSVSENLVSEEKYRFRFRKNLVSEKSLGFGFRKFGVGNNVSVSVSVKILVSSFSGVQGVQSSGVTFRGSQGAKCAVLWAFWCFVGIHSVYIYIYM